jgi:group I intron endonuclease
MYQHHFVYQTTNLVNNKIYVGVHSTDNLEDGYLGSGYYLKMAIEKYGKNNFSRSILYKAESPKDAWAKEAEIVDEDFVKRRDTYNVALGGGRSNYGNKHTDEAKAKMSIASSSRSLETRKKLSEANKNRSKQVKASVSRSLAAYHKRKKVLPLLESYINYSSSLYRSRLPLEALDQSTSDGRAVGEAGSNPVAPTSLPSSSNFLLLFMIALVSLAEN